MSGNRCINRNCSNSACRVGVTNRSRTAPPALYCSTSFNFNAPLDINPPPSDSESSDQVVSNQVLNSSLPSSSSSSSDSESEVDGLIPNRMTYPASSIRPLTRANDRDTNTNNLICTNAYCRIPLSSESQLPGNESCVDPGCTDPNCGISQNSSESSSPAQRPPDSDRPVRHGCR